MFSSVSFDNCIHLCNLHSKLGKEQLYHPRKFPLAPLHSTPSVFLFSLLGNCDFYHPSFILPVPRCHTFLYLPPFVEHVFEIHSHCSCISNSFLFLLNTTPLYEYTMTYPFSRDGHLIFFPQFLAVVNKTFMIILIYFPEPHCIYILIIKYIQNSPEIITDIHISPLIFNKC